MPLRKPPTRLALVVHSLGAGGAERTASILAGSWAGDGREVTLITLAARSTDFYVVPQTVLRIGLGLSGESKDLWAALRNNLSRLAALRRSIVACRAEVVVSFVESTNLLTLLSTVGTGKAVVVSEQVHPQYHPIGLARSILRRWLYPRANAVVVQTEQIGNWMREHVPGSRLSVIPNPVRPCPGDALESESPSRQPTIIAIGRLVPQKGFDLLLQAFARAVAGHHHAWMLRLIGDGPEKEGLSTLASELGIADRVELTGLVRNPGIFLRRADLFVLSSRFEGMPNVLLEAMACGLPVVSFDCPSGPRDVIRHEVDGLLVPAGDVESLAAALDRLMSSESERRRLGACAKEVVERFSVERVSQMWDDALSTAVAASR